VAAAEVAEDTMMDTEVVAAAAGKKSDVSSFNVMANANAHLVHFVQLRRRTRRRTVSAMIVFKCIHPQEYNLLVVDIPVTMVADTAVVVVDTLIEVVMKIEGRYSQLSADYEGQTWNRQRLTCDVFSQ